jgi:lysophospholipase L1-like esterase
VAIGDSFTEGLNDAAPGGGYRGWADRLAGMMAAEYPGLQYANLAVRGKLLRQIVAEQVPAAVAVSTPPPGLVSIAGGGNDIIRPGGDPDTLAELFDAAVARLRAAGCRVLMFTGADLVGFPVLRLLRGRIAAYNMHLRSIADERGCDLVDLWSMRFLRDLSAWSPDRLHMTSQSHQRVALRACEVLGLPVIEDWRDDRAPAGSPLAWEAASRHRGLTSRMGGSRPPFPLAPPITPGASHSPWRPREENWLTSRRDDARWAREYLAPWVNRRLHGVSSGDGRTAKRPQLSPVSPPILM